jgi:hypothetical protein
MNNDLLSMEETAKMVGLLTANMAFNFAKQERLEIYPFGKNNFVDGKDVIEALVLKGYNRKELEKKMNDIIRERKERLKKESP